MNDNSRVTVRFVASGVDDFPVMEKLHNFLKSFIKPFGEDVVDYSGTMCCIDLEMDLGSSRDEAIDLCMTDIHEGICSFKAVLQMPKRVYNSDSFQKFLFDFTSNTNSVKVFELYEHALKFEPTCTVTLCVKHFGEYISSETTLRHLLYDYFGSDAKYTFSTVENNKLKVCINCNEFKTSSTSDLQGALDELASCLFEYDFSLIDFNMVCNVAGTNMNRSSL